MKDFFSKIKDFFKSIMENLGDEGLSKEELEELKSIAKPVPQVSINSSIEIGKNGVQRVETIIPSKQQKGKKADIERVE